MCGFIGIYKKKIKTRFEDIIRFILHRGPDEIGFFENDYCSLFSARLAIRDINVGKQPYSKKDNKYDSFLAYNGEIYNLNKQKKKYRNLRSNCDTELIYEIFRSDDLQKIISELNVLDGQFAISFFNNNTKNLYLARDKLGEKPLYWSRHKGSIIFASEIKPILFLKNQNIEFDEQQILSLSYFWSTHPSRTPYKDIFSIEPGSIYKFGIDGNYEKIFYENKSNNISLKGFFKDKQKNIAVSDRNVGAYLSGGVDSYISTRLILKKNIKTFGIGFTEKKFDETKKQQQISELLKTSHHILNFNKKKFIENIINASFYAEIPNTRFAHIPMYMLSKKAKSENVPVIITGEGADEFFLGYDVFLENFIINNFSKIRNNKNLVSSMFNYMPQNIDKDKFVNFKLANYKNLNMNIKRLSKFGINISRYQMGSFFHKSFYPDVNNYDFVKKMKNYILEKYKNFNKFNIIKKTQILEIETLLSGNLLSIQGDRMSMANSIETRSPFLDKNLIRLNLSKLNDIYNNKFFQKPILKKFYFKNYSNYNKIFGQKFPFRSPESYLFSKSGKNFFYSLINENKKRGLRFDKNTSLKLYDELSGTKFRQPSKLQAITLITNINATYYALRNANKFLQSKNSLEKYKQVINVKNEKFKLQIFKNEKI